MLPINTTPALAARTPPLTDSDAAARATELTAETIEGLIGSVWLSLDQLTKGLQDAGWKLEAPVYGESSAAVTWVGKAMRRERMIKMFLNCYAGSHVEICNCWVMGDVIEEKPQHRDHPLDNFLLGPN